MITQNDLDIENISYTNKDFAQIYPELVELVKKLTDKWDPELTNESDPGLVLLKLAAFIGDKNNYNVDKNILEQFIPSATQESAARSNYDMLGYNMKYYRSATTNIYFKYNGGNNEIDAAFNEGDGIVTFKAFDTSFKTEDNIVYTLMEDIELSPDIKSVTKLAIQGELTCLNISSTSVDEEDNTKIQLYNLDDNNRLYFPDKNVAENGIFIDKEFYNISNDTAWRRVDNLNDIELGSKVFKFGFDSDKNLPYIEFPQDISDLIGDGITVWYILTDGMFGYATNGSLTELNNYRIVSDGIDINTTLDLEQYSLSNSTAIGARDPETLTEAYNNYKKVIGTFNTLVSRRDYANAIYNHENTDTTHLVSAVQVGDARTDINGVTQILKRDSSGVSYYKYEVDPLTRGYSDIVVHATIPINTTINTKVKYDNTYTPITESQCVAIDEAIYENKAIVHKLSIPASDELNMIQNKYTLNANISTTYKVNEKEQENIISNILKALYEAFNARNVDFGEEIPYDSIVKVIENADNRIKAVFLEDPDINPYLVVGNVSNIRYNPAPEVGSTYEDIQKEILYKNIAAGRMPLYVENTDFKYDYNQSNVTPIDNIKSIEANFDITAETATTLKNNETIQILEDSYIAKVTYPFAVYYALDLGETDKSKVIKSDTLYKLGADDLLYIYYTDSSDNQVFKVYDEGTIIRPSGFDLKDTTGGIGAGDNNSPSRWADFDNGILKKSDPGDPAFTPLYALAVNESIEEVVKNEVVLDSKTQQLFWYVKPTSESDDGSMIFTDNVYILEEGEFLIYPNNDMTSLCVLSSGTKIYYEGGNLQKTVNKDPISLEDLNDCVESEDILTFEKSFKWETKDFSSNNLELIETSITTAVQGDEVTSDESLNSSWAQFTDGNSIKINTSTYTANDLNKLRARTVLSIIGTSDKPQEVLSGQTFKITDSSDNTTTISSGYIQIYPGLDTYNNVFLGTAIYDEEAEEYNYEYYYKLISYELIPQGSATPGSFQELIDNNNLTKDIKNEYVFTASTDASYTTGASSDLKISIFKVGPEGTVDNLKTIIQSADQNIAVTEGVMYYISIPKDLSINEDIPVEVQSELITKLSNEGFDFTAKLNPSKVIDSYGIFDAVWFFDKNNVYNSYTIPKIDFDTSKFRIVGSSKK